jgi:hypothetical protein
LLIQEQCGSQFEKCSCWFKHSVAVLPTLVLLEAHLCEDCPAADRASFECCLLVQEQCGGQP